ncbi:MAG TPA: DUF790 family protein, partial [Polyangiaceae bacterium]|nr:DUF790 family protein [Polyangiaceae bacterium]
ALASLVPHAARCSYFEMEADCALDRGSRLSKLVLRSGDPIDADWEQPSEQSAMERRFLRGLRRVALEWDVSSEPNPLETGDVLIFPDFELVHRRDPKRRWWIEILGFWTPEYLETKLRRLRATNVERILLCVDETRCCSQDELLEDPCIIRYRKRIRPEAILEVIERKALGIS